MSVHGRTERAAGCVGESVLRSRQEQPRAALTLLQELEPISERIMEKNALVPLERRVINNFPPLFQTPLNDRWQVTNENPRASSSPPAGIAS